MALALQDVYDQLTTLDPAIRSWALEPVANSFQPIETRSWETCLYGVMALNVAHHLGQSVLGVGQYLAAELLRLPPDFVLYKRWDDASMVDQSELRQAISVFCLAELRERRSASLITEIEAMGDPLASIEAEPANNTETVAIGRRSAFASVTAAVTFILALFAR